MVEIIRQIPFKELKALRRQFGPGKAGRSAFRIIAKGTPCQAPEILGNQCNNAAQVTIDYDVARVNALEQIASCRECELPIQSGVQNILRNNGVWNSPSFGRNGKGRN